MPVLAFWGTWFPALNHKTATGAEQMAIPDMRVMITESVGLVNNWYRDHTTKATEQARADHDRPSVANPLISVGLLCRKPTLNFTDTTAVITTPRMIMEEKTGPTNRPITKFIQMPHARMPPITLRIEALSILSLVCTGTIVSFWFVVEGSVLFSES
jgi:hypothetical protein